MFAELAAFAITLRLELSEQDKLYKKLLHSEKLASLGEALAGIAHEINNPLTAVLSYASLLESRPRPPEEHDILRTIVSESQRAAALIKEVLAFSRKETGKRELVDMNNLVAEVAGLKQFQLKACGARLVVVPGPAPCPVLVCPQQIKQVLLNLVTNSEHAIPAGRTDGTITLTVSHQAGHVQVTVRDNGTGIPPDARKYIFDPFFTTKGPGKGTGLGLSIAYSIVEAHGGTIRLTSSTPAGTVFTLKVPSADAVAQIPAPPTAMLPAAVPTPELTGRVLLVDDEPHILESLAYYLASISLEVRPAPDGRTALELLAAHAFDVVVSDIRMPGMDGLQLYEAARRMNPLYEKRFVFISGYLLRENTKAFLATTGVPYLEKPFSFDELRRALAPLLTEGRAGFACPPPLAKAS